MREGKAYADFFGLYFFLKLLDVGEKTDADFFDYFLVFCRACGCKWDNYGWALQS
jgi:hypothetical protein